MMANPILLQKNTAVSLSALQSGREFRWMKHWVFLSLRGV